MLNDSCGDCMAGVDSVAVCTGLSGFAMSITHTPVWPGALYGMLKYHAELLPDKPILLIENGAELMHPRPTVATQFFEVKHRGPDGVVIDTSEHPWVGGAGLE